ncbi:MAG TPA: hypothetical protein DEQ30_10855 [Porphyromonadaceae bacterium]|nr:hypothetical protein [Porphyromonadaceae bacterium]
MSGVPDEFYEYLQQKGYTNLCRGNSSDGNYVVPNVQVDSVQLTKNEIYFNISYPMIQSRFDVTKQRRFTIRHLHPIYLIAKDPTLTVRSIYEATGGDKAFERSYEYYTQGTYDANAKVFGRDSVFSRSSPERYVTDTQVESASRYNMWVKESGVFKMNDVPIPIIRLQGGPVTPHGMPVPEMVLSSSFTNYLIGCFIKGVGYENIEFPLNGEISCMLKDAGIVKDALSEFYKLNKGKKSDLQTFSDQINGTTIMNNARSLVLNGIAHPETLIGSAFITVSQYNEKEILVKVFDIKSLTSGDFSKHVPLNNYPVSLVRDTTKNDNRYTNTSQTYSFTLPIDFDRLEKDN